MDGVALAMPIGLGLVRLGNFLNGELYGNIKPKEISKYFMDNFKQTIHPSQIEQINRLFSPSNEEIDYARQVIKVFEESKSKGRGSTSLNGQVIDVPVVKRAESILALYNELVFDKSSEI